MANRNQNWKKSKDKKNYKGRDKYDKDKKDEVLDAEGRNNDPNWYFTDAAMAEQVSQLSFQNLAGYALSFQNKEFDIPNLVRMFYNPCPGVIKDHDYGSTVLNKTSGINLAGFKLFSKLSAYTGRVATYAPQDISMMILAFGEIISVMEWMRRVFGLANASSMRNRSYPREVLEWGCLVDEEDFFKHFADYRTRFNGLITMVNQLPIPKGITYFDKCASLYEKVYLDSPSSMGQSLITCPFSTWIIDENSDPNGTRLKTTRWMCEANLSYDPFNPTVRKFSEYLDTADKMIGALLASSTLQVVYTDLLNLSIKVGQEFWKLDYLLDGYLVLPEYNANMLLQMHNATIAGCPSELADKTTPHVTAYNDVVSNANINSVYYNPGFKTLNGIPDGSPRTGTSVLIDMLTDNPDVVDRIECTRYTSIGGTKYYVGPTNVRDMMCDATLPDHYVVMASFLNQDPSRNLANYLGATFVGSDQFPFYVSYLGTIDWAPRIWEVDRATGAFTGNYLGDLNFYTVVDDVYLRKLHQFMTLGLYDLRRGDVKK